MWGCGNRHFNIHGATIDTQHLLLRYEYSSRRFPHPHIFPHIPTSKNYHIHIWNINGSEIVVLLYNYSARPNVRKQFAEMIPTEGKSETQPFTMGSLIYSSSSGRKKLTHNEGCDTSKILYEVSKNIWGEFLRILRIFEDSLGFLEIPGGFWGFLGIPRDS